MFKKIWTLIFLLQIYVLCWAQKEDYFATEWNKIDKLKENDFSSKNRFFKIKSLLKEAKILKNQQYIIKGYYSLIKHQYSFDDYPYNQIDSIYAYLQSERLKSPEIVPEIFEFLETVILFEYRFTRNYLIYTQNKYDTTELISKMSLTQLDEMIFQRYLNLIKNKTAFNGYSNSKPISNFITQNHSNLKLELFDIIVWEILHNLNKISQLH